LIDHVKQWHVDDVPLVTHKDPRGFLGSFNLEDVKFQVKRIYWISVGRDQHRGFHAHKSLSQAMFLLSGQVQISLEGTDCSEKILMHPGKSVTVYPGVWREFIGLDKVSTLLVLASEVYDEDDYIRNYDDFVRWKSGLL
jgi:mannose-6-phosphate isomerase-like protein (cupin superfamily)